MQPIQSRPKPTLPTLPEAQQTSPFDRRVVAAKTDASGEASPHPSRRAVRPLGSPQAADGTLLSVQLHRDAASQRLAAQAAGSRLHQARVSIHGRRRIAHRVYVALRHERYE